MKSQLGVVVVAVVFAIPVHATEQRPDFLVVDGAIYRLPVDSIYPCDQPLQQLWTNPQAELGLDVRRSDCWRGYIAFWEFQNDRLYLRALDAWRNPGTDPNQRQKVSLQSIFHERVQNGRMPADWFKGHLTVLPSSDWSRECTLSFDKGRLVPDKEAVRNRDENGKPIPQNPDVLLYDDTVYYLPASFSEKLLSAQSLWRDSQTRPRMCVHRDGKAREYCTRGYFALWEVYRDYLYLVAIDTWIYGAKANVNTLFPGRLKDGRMKADWFSGDLKLMTGNEEVILPIFEKEFSPSDLYQVTLRIRDGRLRSVQKLTP